MFPVRDTIPSRNPPIVTWALIIANVCLFVFPILFYPLFVVLPAFVYLLIWFMMQFFSGTLSLLEHGQAGGIAWWAHIGGFVAGVALYRRFLSKSERATR